MAELHNLLAHASRSALRNAPVKEAKFDGLPKWAVLYVEGETEPRACTNCHMMLKRQETCAIHGPEITIRPLTVNDKTYVPVCGLQDYGVPMDVAKPMYPAENDPELTGLEWVLGKGTNCGGLNGGRWCAEHYAKRGAEQAFCDVLEAEAKGIDCCAANENNDAGASISWREAQKLLMVK